MLVAFPVALRHWQRMVIKEAHLEVLSGAAATGAVFAELFMIKSLLVFDPLQRVRGGLRSLSEEDSEPPSPAWNTSRVRPSMRHWGRKVALQAGGVALNVGAWGCMLGRQQQGKSI